MKLTTGNRISVWVGPTIWLGSWEVIGVVRSKSLVGTYGVLCKIVTREKDKPKFCIAQPGCTWHTGGEVNITWTSWYTGNTIKDIKYVAANEATTWDTTAYENK